MECRKCGSTKIMKDTVISDFVDYGASQNLSVRIQKTDRAFFNQYAKAEIVSDICGNCGHMELKVANPKELWDAYSKNK